VFVLRRDNKRDCKKDQKNQCFQLAAHVSRQKKKMHYALGNSILALLKFFLLFLCPLNYN